MLLIRALNYLLLVLCAGSIELRRAGDYPVSYLTNMDNQWYINDPKGQVLLKIVARGRASARGRVCAIAENNKPYMFYRPPNEFWNFLLKQPIRYDMFRLRFNGTDFLVRRHVQSGWRRVTMHGIGEPGEHTLHLFDEDNRWYRFPNGTQLTAYMERKPKTVACADNHRLALWDNGTWYATGGTSPRAFANVGTIVITFRSSDGAWYGLKNPSEGLRNYTGGLPAEIYDPYNFTASDSQIYYPKIRGNTSNDSTSGMPAKSYDPCNLNVSDSQIYDPAIRDNQTNYSNTTIITE